MRFSRSLSTWLQVDYKLPLTRTLALSSCTLRRAWEAVHSPLSLCVTCRTVDWVKRTIERASWRKKATSDSSDSMANGLNDLSSVSWKEERQKKYLIEWIEWHTLLVISSLVTASISLSLFALVQSDSCLFRSFSLTILTSHRVKLEAFATFVSLSRSLCASSATMCDGRRVKHSP